MHEALPVSRQRCRGIAWRNQRDCSFFETKRRTRRTVYGSRDDPQTKHNPAD